MFCWRHMRRGPGRPFKPRFLSFEPRRLEFLPVENGRIVEAPPVYMRADELEAFKLVYLEGLTQEDAATRMGISRGTLWRCLESARKKLAEMLAYKRPLVILPSPSQP